MRIEQPKSSPNRTKGNNELIAALTADGAPADIIELWKIQADMCYCAYLAGKTAARRMQREGEIEEDRVVEVGLEFAKLLVMKISLTPAKQPPAAGIVIPQIQGLPGKMN